MTSTPAVLEDGRRSLRLAAVPDAVEQERAWLGGRGGQRFGLLAANGCGWLVADLALGQSGLLNVPLPGFFTDGQLLHVLDDAALDRIVTDAPDRIRRLAPEFSVLGTGPGSGLCLLGRRGPVGPAPVPVDTLKVTYTSGSTGTPKGVCLTAAGLDAVTGSLVDLRQELGLRRHLCLLPLATLLENVAGALATLGADGTCIVPDGGATGMEPGGVDAHRLTDTIAAAEPDSLILVPELLRLLLAATTAGWTPPASLRFVAVGGARVAPELLEQATAAGLPVFEGYGLSECGSVVALNTPGANRPGSVGRPLPHTRVRVSADGEILVSGATFAGYLGEPGSTHGGMAGAMAGAMASEIATGDLGELDRDGWLHVRGRRRNVLITSFGRNVSPEWVESELLAEPAIGQALVAGDARPWLCALLHPARRGVGTAELEAAVRRANARLPAYARIGAWRTLDAPLTAANGTLTANGRPRRDVILARYRRQLDRLYALERKVC